jgi:hypothetical protein
MKLYVKNTLDGLIPLYPADQDERRKLKIGKEYEVEIKHPRNYQFHKKFFALLNMCFENYETEMPFDTFRRWLIMRAGFVNIYTTDKGTFYDAQSIAFGSMDEQQFQEVYNKVLDVVIKLLGITEEDVMDNLINFM